MSASDESDLGTGLPIRIGVRELSEAEAMRRLAVVLDSVKLGETRSKDLERYVLKIPLEQGPEDRALFEAYRRMLRSWNVAERPPLESHRPVIGPWIVRAKKLTRRALAFELDPFFERQTRFNRAVLELVRLMLTEIGRLRRRNRELEKP